MKIEVEILELVKDIKGNLKFLLKGFPTIIDSNLKDYSVFMEPLGPNLSALYN
jgi:hypothetical protein